MTIRPSPIQFFRSSNSFKIYFRCLTSVTLMTGKSGSTRQWPRPRCSVLSSTTPTGALRLGVPLALKVALASLEPTATPARHSAKGMIHWSRSSACDCSRTMSHASRTRGHDGCATCIISTDPSKKWGIRSKVTLRSDNEFATVDLLDRVGKIRSGETLLEQSPRSDSGANVRSERTIQQFQKKGSSIEAGPGAEIWHWFGSQG